MNMVSVNDIVNTLNSFTFSGDPAADGMKLGTMYMQISMLLASKQHELLVTKLQHDTLEAELDARHRINKEAQKLTEKAIQSMILQDQGYQQSLLRVYDLEREVAMLKSILHTVDIFVKSVTATQKLA